MEASSHALALDRLWGCHFAVAVFTNLTRDHIDFHKNFENYFAAKRRLFEGTGASAPDVAVINTDDEWGKKLVGLGKKTFTYGLTNGADLKAKKFALSFSGLNFTAQTPAGAIQVESPLVGRINVYNILAAIRSEWSGSEGQEICAELQRLELYGADAGRRDSGGIAAGRADQCLQHPGGNRRGHRIGNPQSCDRDGNPKPARGFGQIPTRRSGAAVSGGGGLRAYRRCAAELDSHGAGTDHQRTNHHGVWLRRFARPDEAPDHGGNLRPAERPDDSDQRQPAAGRSTEDHQRRRGGDSEVHGEISDRTGPRESNLAGD